MLNTASRRTAALVAVLVALGAGCNDSTSPGDDDHAGEVHAIRLTVGEQVITIDGAGTVTGGPLVIGVGDAALSAQFLDDDDEIVPVDPAEFRIQVEPADAEVVTFALQTAFAGTLTGVAAGGTQLEVCLFHIEEDHCDFGEFDVPVTVEEQPDP